MFAALHPLLSPSQTLGLLWISRLLLGELRRARGGTSVKNSSRLPLGHRRLITARSVLSLSTALITPRDLLRSTKKALQRSDYPEFNWDAFFFLFSEKTHHKGFGWDDIVKTD